MSDGTAVRYSQLFYSGWQIGEAASLSTSMMKQDVSQCGEEWIKVQVEVW